MTDPQHKLGDIVNGHRLTEQPDRSQVWLPVEAEPQPRPVDVGLQHKPGDVANGHRLTVQRDGTQAWLPIEVEPKPKKSRRPLWITLGAVGAVLLLIIIIGSLNRPSTKADDTAAERPAAVAEEPAAEPEPVMVSVPDVTGMPADLAIASLTALGFQVPYNDDMAATVLFTTPAAGTMYAEGKSVSLTVEQKPQLTLGQQNSVGKAEQYLSLTAFSRSGLIHQLEFEGFSTEDATFAVDYIGADWNAQAAAKAKQYLELTSFSREGLYDQLIFEGFSDAEANAGLAAVGY